MLTAGLSLGLTTLPREPKLGLKRLGYPVGYWRCPEFAYVWDTLGQEATQRILDLGSPKDLAIFLARHRQQEVVATDIMSRPTTISRRYAEAGKLAGEGPGHVRSEQQDGRALSYEDNSFDAAYSVSVLEHIPDTGDTAAMRELLRVVKPGGIVVVTVPFAKKRYDEFHDGDVYERRSQNGEPVFFQRHYDDEDLRERLINLPGAELVDLRFWGERMVHVENLITKAGPFRLALCPLEWPLSMLFLREVNGSSTHRPMAAFFTVRKRA